MICYLTEFGEAFKNHKSAIAQSLLIDQLKYLFPIMRFNFFIPFFLVSRHRAILYVFNFLRKLSSNLRFMPPQNKWFNYSVQFLGSSLVILLFYWILELIPEVCLCSQNSWIDE